MIHILPPREDVSSYLGPLFNPERVALVMSRIQAAMVESGMQLGPAGVFISPEGIAVDSDLSSEVVESAWLNFNIAAYRTPTERKKTQTEAMALGYIQTLRSEADILDSATPLTVAQIRGGLAKTNRTLATLIDYLLDQGVIQGS